MSTPFQVVVDCTEPHRLVRFWAEVLAYEVEEQDADFIRRMIAEGYATADQTTEVDGKLVWKEGVAAVDPEGRSPRVLFQLVPEAKTVKNRLHLDLRVGPDRVDAEVERLVGLGASRLWTGRQGPHEWVTMADPEGNEFCVS